MRIPKVIRTKENCKEFTDYIKTLPNDECFIIVDNRSISMVNGGNTSLHYHKKDEAFAVHNYGTGWQDQAPQLMNEEDFIKYVWENRGDINKSIKLMVDRLI